MNNLYRKLQADLLDARKNKLTLEASLLSTLIGDLQNKCVTVDSPIPSDDHVIGMVNSYIKNLNTVLRIENITTSALESANMELALLSAYLPTQLTAEEIKKIVDDRIANGLSNKGLMMKHFKDNYFGRYDAKALADSL